MAKYKVWLTVKDRYGNIKELDSGTIDVALNDLTDTELEVIDKHYATDTELATAIKENNSIIHYTGFSFSDSVNEEGV
jgi:hypothetical protein